MQIFTFLQINFITKISGSYYERFKVYRMSGRAD